MPKTIENQLQLNEIDQNISINQRHYLPKIGFIGLCGLIGLGGVFHTSIENFIPNEISNQAKPIVDNTAVSYQSNKIEKTTSEGPIDISTSTSSTVPRTLPGTNYSFGPISTGIGNFPKVSNVKQVIKPTLTNETILMNEIPPHTVEEFAATTLAEIAIQKNIPLKDTLTQEHLNALIAWIWTEGGDINNNNLFNPLNSGINLPNYIAGEPNYTGNQSFKSYQDGIMATTLTLLLPQYSRLADTLINPNTTATEFFQALTNYQMYQNNIYWAQSDTNNPAQGWSQTTYLDNLLSVGNQVSQKYNYYASLEIGTGVLEEQNNLRQPQMIKYANGWLNQFISS